VTGSPDHDVPGDPDPADEPQAASGSGPADDSEAAGHADQTGHREPLSRRERLETAAIEAELATGRREPTIAAAKRSLLVRFVSAIAGVFLVIFGIIMIPLPGPGLLIIIGGLTLLAPDVPFAARLLERLKAKVPTDEQGRYNRRLIAVGVVFGVAITGFGVWWNLLR
jgi:uncharacterized protein (TIGR02611 family)